jgi:hypothetical protein
MINCGRSRRSAKDTPRVPIAHMTWKPSDTNHLPYRSRTASSLSMMSTNGRRSISVWLAMSAVHRESTPPNVPSALIYPNVRDNWKRPRRTSSDAIL